MNHKNKETSYRAVVSSNNTVQMEQTVILKYGDKIEIPFNFTVGEPGKMKMEFLLFNSGITTIFPAPYTCGLTLPALPMRQPSK